MGINLEYVTLISDLKAKGHLSGGKVIELGAQDISADHKKISAHAKKFPANTNIPSEIKTAHELYAAFGYGEYQAIDASGEYGAHVFDLNADIQKTYNFHEQFDLVTNLGTIEHCFNPAQAIENMHNICKENGLIIHAFPSNGNANHGFYNMQPRLFILMAQANGYDLIDYVFTADYKPRLISFSHKNYAAHDDRDILSYVVFRKKNSAPFIKPFDSMFDEKNKLGGYTSALDITEFKPYIKGSWLNIRPRSLYCVPTQARSNPSLLRTVLKPVYDYIGRYI